MKKILLAIILVIMMQTSTFANQLELDNSLVTAIQVLPTNSIVIRANHDYVEYTDETGFPFVDENGRSLVPLRKTFESLEIMVEWDSELNAAIVKRWDDEVIIPIGRNEIFKNGQPIILDTQAIIVNGHTYVPIRPIIEALGGVVDWDESTRSTDLYFEYDYQEFYFNEMISNEMNAYYISNDVYQRMNEMMELSIKDHKSLDEFKQLLNGKWSQKERLIQIEFEENDQIISTKFYLVKKYGKLKLSVIHTLQDGTEEVIIDFVEDDMITIYNTDANSTVLREGEVVSEFIFTPQANNKFDYQLISTIENYEEFEKNFSGEMAFMDNDTLVHKVVFEKPSFDIKKITLVIIEERIK